MPEEILQNVTWTFKYCGFFCYCSSFVLINKYSWISPITHGTSRPYEKNTLYLLVTQTKLRRGKVEQTFPKGAYMQSVLTNIYIIYWLTGTSLFYISFLTISFGEGKVRSGGNLAFRSTGEGVNYRSFPITQGSYKSHIFVLLTQNKQYFLEENSLLCQWKM